MGGRRPAQFPKLLFTNRITAMHRDQKLLVMESDDVPVTPILPRKSPLISPNQCTDKCRITVTTQFLWIDVGEK